MSRPLFVRRWTRVSAGAIFLFLVFAQGAWADDGHEEDWCFAYEAPPLREENARVLAHARTGRVVALSITGDDDENPLVALSDAAIAADEKGVLPPLPPEVSLLVVKDGRWGEGVSSGLEVRYKLPRVFTDLSGLRGRTALRLQF